MSRRAISTTSDGGPIPDASRAIGGHSEIETGGQWTRDGSGGAAENDDASYASEEDGDATSSSAAAGWNNVGDCAVERTSSAADGGLGGMHDPALVPWVDGGGASGGFGGIDQDRCEADSIANGPDGSTAPIARANGDGCLTDGECQSTHCVDSVCCKYACDSQCRTRNQGGKDLCAFMAYEVAFQTKLGRLWTVGATGPGNTERPMMAGTSPSIAVLSNGGWVAAFQAESGNLWITGLGDTGLKMMTGTSPSLAAMADDDWEVAFQGDTGHLWVLGNRVAARDTKLEMMAGTSPSIAAMTGGGWRAAFHSATGHLWVIDGQNTSGDTDCPMAPKTNPSITGRPDGDSMVAIQSDTGFLWIYGIGYMGLGMMPATSPSITTTDDGGWEVAFQSDTGDLWTTGDEGRRTNMNLGMMAGTNPSIVRTVGGGWKIAIQANSRHLWIVVGRDRGFLDWSATDTYLEMMTGTSPAIAAD